LGINLCVPAALPRRASIFFALHACRHAEARAGHASTTRSGATAYMASLGTRTMIPMAFAHATGRREEAPHTESVQVPLVCGVAGRGRDFRPEIWAQKRAAAWRNFTVRRVVRIGRIGPLWRVGRVGRVGRVWGVVAV